LKRLRVDGGGEFNSLEFKNFCAENGIPHEATPPYTPRDGKGAGRGRVSLSHTHPRIKNSSPSPYPNPTGIKLFSHPHPHRVTGIISYPYPYPRSNYFNINFYKRKQITVKKT